MLLGRLAMLICYMLYYANPISLGVNKCVQSTLPCNELPSYPGFNTASFLKNYFMYRALIVFFFY